MARGNRQTDPGFGSDSFMDIVANVVGILIILVIVVGIRAGQPLPNLGTGVLEEKDLSGLKGRVAALAEESDEARRMAEDLARQTIARQAEADELAARIAARERELAARRDEATARSQRVEGIRQEYAVAVAYLKRLETEREQVGPAEPAAVTIESYPTPISRSVEGNEAHFQLIGGRITYIPLDDLLEKLRAAAVQQLWKLKDQHEASDTIGPIGGFRMKYTMERVDLPAAGAPGGRGGSYAQLSQWQLVPVQSQLGETIDQALRDGSDFYRALARTNPRNTTVTVWVYPDSFNEFRRVRKELYRLGYPTAGRPLTDGHPIGGSPRGSKSAAQ
jgi:hypothetical protein